MNRIKNVLFLGALVALAGIGGRTALADTPQLADLWFNVDGTFTEGAGAGVDDTTHYDLTATGLGTITFTDTTVGTDYFNAFWNVAVGTEFYDEYGSTSGTPAAGGSWEIGSVPYETSNPSCETSYGLSGAGYVDTCSSTFTDAQSGTLISANGLPSGNSNFLGNCLTSGCNGDVAVALGDSYTLSSGDEEIITLTVSQTAPVSGFYIDQTNPCQDNPCSNAPNAPPFTVGNVYYSLSADYVPAGSGPPTVTPEPSTWLLMLTGLLIPAWRMRRHFALKTWARFTALLAVVAVALSASARAQQVLTVPWDPATPAAPHTAYPGANIVLGAVFINPVSGHSYTYSWNYGDGSAVSGTTAISNFNDISSKHTYPGPFPSPVPGVTSWTAVVTVTDATDSSHPTYTGNYLVIWENNTLQSRVNVAIDWGLWYLHQNMQHTSPTAGNWRNCASGYGSYSCGNTYGSLDASNVQAFEVNGHLATGPATDPYTSDVAEGLADMITYISPQPVAANTYHFNPATVNYGCSDGTAPSSSYSSANAYCDPTSTPVYYNASATSCGTPPCSYTFDGNKNGQYVYAPQVQSWGYEQGMYVDALVASGDPSLTAASLPTPVSGYASGIENESFQNLVQDFADGAGYCQYQYDYDIGNPGYTGYYRGGAFSASGGGWLYDCQEGDDNSTSQWSAIGLIAAQRGFGITIPPIITDANNVWVTNSQTVQVPDYQLNSAYNSDTVDNPGGSNTYDYGSFGYRGAFYYSDGWGPWATTPSGMVQMSLDGIGRTHNTAFGDASSDPDQRFNSAETYYADNFCDALGDGPVYAPLAYTYGMFSFTKSMLLHNPKGTLTPIQYLRTLTPNVFTTNSSVPPNTIDWYAAVSTSHYGGADPCDGVAQTIVGRQRFDGGGNGYWYYDNYEGPQDTYETAWSLIMLQKSVFVACVNNLQGLGTPKKLTAARVDLSWTGIPTATGYEVLRGTANGGPYTEIGTTTNQSYRDTSGLTNGDTYYYVLEPLNVSGVTECQSNQATVTIP